MVILLNFNQCVLFLMEEIKNKYKVTELNAYMWIVHVWKDSFSFRLSKLKTNIRINTHGLYEKEAVSQGTRSNILWS